MQPLMFSSAAFQLNQQGWVRAGTKISYYSNNYNASERVTSKKKKTYYTMTFSVVFKHETDTCYFAYHYPYTYSMLLVRKNACLAIIIDLGGIFGSACFNTIIIVVFLSMHSLIWGGLKAALKRRICTIAGSLCVQLSVAIYVLSLPSPVLKKMQTTLSQVCKHPHIVMQCH